MAIAIAPDGKGPAAGQGRLCDRASRCTRSHAAPAMAPTCRASPDCRTCRPAPPLRLIGGRGTLTTKNPMMTVESYWPYATTLFDYVRRAMPFKAPGSLTRTKSTRSRPTSWPKANIIDKATVLDARACPVQMPNRDGFIPDPRPELFK